MTSSWSHNWESKSKRRLSWCLGAQRVFHVATHNYQVLERFAVKTLRNEFFHYSSICGRLSSAFYSEMKHKSNVEIVDTKGVSKRYAIKSCIRLRIPSDKDHLQCDLRKNSSKKTMSVILEQSVEVHEDVCQSHCGGKWPAHHFNYQVTSQDVDIRKSVSVY